MNNQNQNNMLMGILAYLGILVVIPFAMSRQNAFVKFHVKQGLVLLVIEIAVWIVGSLFWPLWMLLQIVNLAVLILAILGIINVVQGHEKELPVVGSFAKHFKI